MVTGHMEKGKFHPHTQYKGVRKARNRFHPKGYKPPTFGKKKPAGTWEITKTRVGSKNVVRDQNEVTIFDDNGVEVVKWVRDEWEEDPTIIPAIRNAIKLANQGRVDEIKRLIKFNETPRPRKARYAFDNSEEPQVIIPEYSRGDIVMVSPENDNEGYDDFRNKKLRITDVSTNIGEHRGFDESVGQALYELETLNGEQIFSSLYDYELVSA